MIETKPKKSTYLTGTYPGKWCWLLTPNTRFSEEGEYSVDLMMPTDDARALCKSVGDEVARQRDKVLHDTPKAKDWKLQWPVKDDEDNAANKLVTFKQKIKAGYNFSVDVFDAKKHLIEPTSGLRIGNGTKLRISFYVRVVADNLSSCIRVLFHPRAAQIVELVKWEADYGFEETEGFEAGGNRHAPAAKPPTDDPFTMDQAGVVDDDIPF